MKFRSKMSKKGSRKLFSRTASRTNSKNMRSVPMRGGFRIQL